MQIKSLFILASLAVSSFAEVSFSQVQDDIHYEMASAVANFNIAVDEFSMFGGTHRQAMAIHSSASALNTVIADTTNDINAMASKLSDAEAQDLFGYLHYLEPSFLESLTGIAVRKPAIGLIRDVQALIKQDLVVMKKSADDFMDAFINHAPLSVMVEAQTMKTSVDAMFSSLLLFYGI